MKKILLLTLICGCSIFLKAQDTTWVQTFTFDSIETRRANFQFPASLDNQRFEKVLMYYKLKCSPLTTWDQYNCGEWDYLTYTRVFDHTGVMDSVQVDGTRYRVNTQSPSAYEYTTQAYFDQQQTQVQRRTQNAVTVYPVSGTAATPMAFVNNGSNGATLQWIIPAADLAAGGVTAGDLQGMELNFLNTLATLQGVQIRVKHTLLSTLTTWETAGFTTVYSDELTNLLNGTNTVNFSAPFTYDGTSNLVIEVSFTDARQNLTQVDLETITATGSANTLRYDNENGVFVTNATSFAEINLSHVDLGQDVTIAFWAKGNGSYGTNTSILEAVDSLDQRIFNIHMPWSDNTIYFDAGANGGSFDRIQKATTSSTDIDAVWHHWAFVKKASTGEMFIYKDGVLWHSGTGKTRPVGKVDRFFLGSNWNQDYKYKGSIDEFSVWSTALDAATVSAWKNKKVDASHPNYSDLEVYYDFDGQLAMIDRSTHNRLGMCSEANMVQHAVSPVAGTVSSAVIPEAALIQGTMNAAVADTILVAQFPATDVVFEYAATDNSFQVLNNMVTYPIGSIDTLAISGSTLSSAPAAMEDTLANNTVTYYEPPFELVNDVEIGRYITPYGIGFDLGPQGFAWIYDVTDYQKYLNGMVDLAAHNTQELLDLKFAFIEGIPPRDVHDVEPIWRNFADYNYGQMAGDQVLQATPVVLADTSDMFKVRTRMTGHGHNGNGNCCEWQDKEHRILIDGVERAAWHIWQANECGENPNISQGGTWPYAREGWCPGDMVKDFSHEITPFVTPGDTVMIDYDVDDVPSGDAAQAGGNYVAAFDLVSYSAPNFQHDAALVDVLNPNNYEYYSKWNPTCSNPRVIIQNTGAEPLTSVKIVYWVTTDFYETYTWTGNLPFLEKEMIELPITDQAFWFGAATANGFHAEIMEIEGAAGVDEYAQNNHFKTNYTAPEVVESPFYAWYKTNNRASENKWRLIDGAGNTIFERTVLQNSTEYKDTFDLAPGCYSIIVEDSDHDGLSFWYSAQVEGETAGNFRVREVGGSVIESLNADFGKYARYDFTIGFTVGVAESELADEFLVSPNPSSDKIRVEYVGNIGAKAVVEVLDLNGRILMQNELPNLGNTYGIDFAVDQLNSGMYFVKITGELGSRTTQFIKQ